MSSPYRVHEERDGHFIVSRAGAPPFAVPKRALDEGAMERIRAMMPPKMAAGGSVRGVAFDAPDFDPRVYQAIAEGTVTPTGLPTEAAMRRSGGYPLRDPGYVPSSISAPDDLAQPKSTMPAEGPSTSYPVTDSDYAAERARYEADQRRPSEEREAAARENELQVATEAMKRAQYDWYQRGGPKPSSNVEDYLPQATPSGPAMLASHAQEPALLASHVPSGSVMPPVAMLEEAPAQSAPNVAAAAQGAREYLGHPLQGDQAAQAPAQSEEDKAIQAQQTAQEKAAAQEQAIRHREMDQAAQAEAQFRGAMADITKRSNEVAAAKLDSGRLWASKSTGSKILTAIGIAFSGLGAGLQGKESPVNRMLADAIKQDLDLQLSDKTSMLNQLRQQGMDLKAAYDATRARLIEETQAQLANVQSSLRPGQAAIDAVKLKADLEKERQASLASAAQAHLARQHADVLVPAQAADQYAGAQLKRAEAARNMVQVGMTGQIVRPRTGAVYTNEMRDRMSPEDRKRMVLTPKGWLAATDDKERDQIQARLDVLKELEQDVQEMARFNEGVQSKRIPWSEAAGKLQTLKGKMLGEMKELSKDKGPMTEPDIKRFESMMGDPASWRNLFGDSAKGAQTALLDLVDRGRKNTYQQLLGRR